MPNLRQFPALRADVAKLRQVVEAWHARFVEPAIATVRRGERLPEDRLAADKVAFDSVRDAYGGLYADLDQQRQASHVRLNRVTTRLTGALVASVAALVAMGLLIWLAFRRWVAAPLASLGGDARLVADGNLSHEVGPTGPAEFQALARDLEAMRVRIVAEVDALEVRSTDLARSNADLEQFAYVASHDLQEPLRKVASFCQLLQKRYQGQLDERADQYIEFAVDGAKRMQALINDLLTFSRVGRLIGDLAEVDCDAALARALANVETACEEAAAAVVADPLPVVQGDLSLLTALFQNLVDNAIKYRRPDVAPEVCITVARVDDNWEFAVADNGIGIAPEYAERVFVIFQRLHAKEEYPASAWPSASASWSSTAAGSGSTPTGARAAPVTRARAQPYAGPSRSTSRPSRRRRPTGNPTSKETTPTLATDHDVSPINILLVEDDPGDVLMTREALEEHKVMNNLFVVNNGEDAVSFLTRQGDHAAAPGPDLILLDLNLPRLDGREVLARIKADEELRRIPVVVLTTSQAEEDILRSYDLHANAYVAKPVDFEQFSRVVRQIDEFFISIVRLPPR